MDRDLRVIDADAHITEPPDLWTRHAPEAFADRVPRVVETGGVDQWVVDGVVLGRAFGSTVIRSDGEKVGGTEFMAWGKGDSHPSSWDMSARLEVLNALGIYAQVLYPNVGGFGSQRFADVPDPALRRLCASLYNESMIEVQEASGGRLLPMALVPWWDIDATAKELVAIADAGFRGIVMCSDPQNRGVPDLGERAWDDVWATCAEHELSVNFHIGASASSSAWFGESPWPSHAPPFKLAVGSAMMFLSNARVLVNLVFSGVLDRFPDLKVVSVESGVGWIPSFLEVLDYQQAEAAPGTLDQLTMRPSDYFRRQIYACFWLERECLAPAIAALGADRIMFETDYPHPTCLYPDPLAYAEESLRSFSSATQRRLLQDNAAELYRVPLS